MKLVVKTQSRSVYSDLDEPKEFIDWFVKKWDALSPSEKLSAKMHIGRGMTVTMVGLSYTEDAPVPSTTLGGARE